MGESVSGWSTKIHATVDVLGNPLCIILSTGQRVDSTQTGVLLIDPDYDEDSLMILTSEVVIPENQLQQRAIDKNLYKNP